MILKSNKSAAAGHADQRQRSKQYRYASRRQGLGSRVVHRALERVLPRRDFEAATWTGPATISVVSDDGAIEDLTELSPLLEAHGLQGTFAICTELIGTPGFMRRDDLQTLAARGHEIASHLEEHTAAVHLSAADCQRSMSRSKAWLEELGQPVSSLVFPFGANSRSTRLAASSNFDTAMTAWPGLNVGKLNRYALHRIGFGSFEHPSFPVADHPERWVDRLLAQQAWMILMVHPGDAKRRPDHTERLAHLLGIALKRGVSILPASRAAASLI